MAQKVEVLKAVSWAPAIWERGFTIQVSGMSLIYQLGFLGAARRPIFFDQSLTIACELQSAFIDNTALNLLFGHELV